MELNQALYVCSLPMSNMKQSPITKKLFVTILKLHSCILFVNVCYLLPLMLKCVTRDSVKLEELAIFVLSQRTYVGEIVFGLSVYCI